ncbi:MAG: xanthine dehydrogenase family protein subunit M [Acidobacteria bacterium]|nr:xanthine dehydrogenase family protein subunit M [Acidobacteriota bacterium]
MKKTTASDQLLCEHPCVEEEMVPKSFEYFSPGSLSEVLSLLRKYKDDARLLAGGHSLIPLMKLRLVSPKYVIDLRKIPNLSYVREKGGKLLIGAMTTHRQIATSPLIRSKSEILAETAEVIGDPQVRNLGTIGGSIAHADPAGDYLPTLLAAGGQLKAISVRGQKTFKAEDFFHDMFTTALKQDEILTEISVPIAPALSGGTYLKLERKSGDFAVVGVAVQLTLDESNVCNRVKIALGAVGPTVIRAFEAENVLRANTVDDALINEAAKRTSDASEPISDLRGSAEYKKEMVRVFTQRALVKARDRARSNLHKISGTR